MSRGFLWFCQNSSSVDYVECSRALAQSIKKHNRENTICVITDEHSRFQDPNVDVIKVLKNDDSDTHSIKWANEHKAFQQSPFTHTIKLESDMLWTQNTDWWWNYLGQHDLVFSVDVRDYRDRVIKDTTYRKLFLKNNLPNIYNGLTYFRRSQRALKFYNICGTLTLNWQYVRDNFLINCHDEYPSTDVIYALAYRILDPACQQLIDYEWFKFVHHKPAVHGLDHVSNYDDYLLPLRVGDSIMLGAHRLDRVWHYVNKKTVEDLDARIF